MEGPVRSADSGLARGGGRTGWPAWENQPMETLVFIPAWNEDTSVTGVIEGVREHLPDADVLVVDDGSTDATAARARQAGAIVASLPFNQGLGAALQTGYLYALREGYEFCAHLDADGQHPPAEVARLLEEIYAHRADLVIGSRYRDPDVAENDDYKPTLSRRIGTSVFRFFLTLATRQRFTDTTSGMRAANRGVMRLFSENYSPDFAEIESLQLAVRQGLRVEEVPVRMLERVGGSSFLTPLRSSFFIFKGLIVLLVGQFRPARRGDVPPSASPPRATDQEARTGSWSGQSPAPSTAPTAAKRRSK